MISVNSVAKYNEWMIYVAAHLKCKFVLTWFLWQVMQSPLVTAILTVSRFFQKVDV